MNRVLSSGGRGCLSATFSRPIPICFSDELPVWDLVALGVDFYFFVFSFFLKKKVLTFLLFKVGLLDDRESLQVRTPARRERIQKVKKRSPLPKGKHETRTTPSREGQQLSRKRHPPSPFAQLLLLQELGWRLRSRSMA